MRSLTSPRRDSRLITPTVPPERQLWALFHPTDGGHPGSISPWQPLPQIQQLRGCRLVELGPPGCQARSNDSEPWSFDVQEASVRPWRGCFLAAAVVPPDEIGRLTRKVPDSKHPASALRLTCPTPGDYQSVPDSRTHRDPPPFRPVPYHHAQPTFSLPLEAEVPIPLLTHIREAPPSCRWVTPE